MAWLIALTVFYVIPLIGAYINTRKYYELDDFGRPNEADILFVFLPIFNIISFMWHVNQNRATQGKRTFAQTFFRL